MNENDKSVELTDQQLDQLLAHATQPRIPPDFQERMAERVRVAPVNNVVPFPQRQRVRKRAVWRLPVAAALAASLVLGFWLGSGATDQSQLDNAGDTAMLSTTSDFSPSGMDDLDALDVGQQS